MRFVLGIDIGGTNLVVGCVAEDGSALHALASAPTQAEAGASDVVDRLVALAQGCIARARRELPGIEIAGVGVGVSASPPPPKRRAKMFGPPGFAGPGPSSVGLA